MSSQDVILNLLGAGFVGAVITHWIDDKLAQNSENRRIIREHRELQYKDFLKNLMGYYKGWEDKEKQKQFVLDVNTNAIISASDEVYRLAKSYINSFDGSNEQVGEADRQKIYASLVIAMRNELNIMSGENPTTLAENEITVMQLDD